MPIKLIYSPMESPYSSSAPHIKYTINEDIRTYELAEQMKSFMIAMGHHPDNVNNEFASEPEEEEISHSRIKNRRCIYGYIHPAEEEEAKDIVNGINQLLAEAYERGIEVYMIDKYLLDGDDSLMKNREHNSMQHDGYVAKWYDAKDEEEPIKGE